MVFFERILNSRMKRNCRLSIMTLAFFWTGGLVFGIHIAANDVSFLLLMRTVLNDGVSIVGLVAVLILPLLFTFIAVHFRVPFIIYLICVLRAFGNGYCLYALSVIFISASWLIRLLLMFSDCVGSVCLFWYWIRQKGIVLYKREFLVCCSVALIIGLMDYSFVSPFLEMLMNHL